MLGPILPLAGKLARAATEPLALHPSVHHRAQPGFERLPIRIRNLTGLRMLQHRTIQEQLSFNGTGDPGG